MRSYAIGVDLGGTNMRVAAIDDTGTPLAILSALTDVERGREYVIGEMAASIHALDIRFSATHKLLGIGVGIPGIIDLESGTLRAAANLPGWDDYPIRKDLEKRLSTDVILENDANCAALGEKWTGAGRNVDDLCMLTLGTGVGGAFVVNGKPWHGMIGMAGEIGHMTVLPDGVPCGCGNHGCLEQYASATAVRRMAHEAVASGSAPRLELAMKADLDLSAKTVFECAMAGDPVAAGIFERVGSAVGIVLANLINALNLPVYVIGGGLAKAWPAFSPALFRELRDRSIVFCAGQADTASRRTTVVTPALLHENAGLIGAARLPMIGKTQWNFSSLAV